MMTGRSHPRGPPQEPMLNRFRAIMPKDDRFLDRFEQHTRWMAGAESLRAARTLRARHD
jgi:hypothetical protein